MMEHKQLLEENKKLTEQITTARLEREQMQHQIAELRTESDRIREIAKSLVPKSALKQAVQEAAELRSEVAKLRAEVPLESTREGLKNATAKIAELKNDVRRCYELADEIGRGEGESIVDLITRQAERITGLIAKLQEVTTDRDRVLNELAAIVAEANKTGRCGGDPVALLKQGQVDRDTAESLDRQLGAALALSNERAQEIRKLIDGHAEDMKAQAELQGKHESLLAKTTDLGSYAMTLGRKEGEPLEMFMERQALRLAALESKAGPSIEALSAELSVRYAEIAELHKWATGLIESPAFAHYHYERVQEYNAIVARINSRPQLDLTATLPAIDWQAICTKREDEIARLNAKVGPLEKLYTTIKKHLDHGIFFSSGAGIYDAVAETAKELSQLTA